MGRQRRCLSHPPRGVVIVVASPQSAVSHAQRIALVRTGSPKRGARRPQTDVRGLPLPTSQRVGWPGRETDVTESPSDGQASRIFAATDSILSPHEARPPEGRNKRRCQITDTAFEIVHIGSVCQYTTQGMKQNLGCQLFSIRR
mmetsp:Transcript_60069/g.178339  ORF Transcript_60069/g.178339 Transcript_60069/m.178339 type:complete len:144 (+) Transcript_60069:89-520(+)